MPGTDAHVTLKSAQYKRSAEKYQKVVFCTENRYAAKIWNLDISLTMVCTLVMGPFAIAP
jgi:hypothetical protein